MKNKRLTVLFAFLVIASVAFIFYNSAQTGEESSKASNTVTDIINKLLSFFGISPEQKALSHIVRKLAHFSEYFVLGFVTASFVKYLTGKTKYIALSPLLALLVAACDEFIVQGTTKGRSPQWTDVLIDVSGAITAALFVALLLFVIAKRLQKRENSK